MSQLEDILLEQEKNTCRRSCRQPTHSSGKPSEQSNRQRGSDNRKPSARLDNRLRAKRGARQLHSSSHRVQHQQRVMEVPLAFDDLPHLPRFIGVIVMRKVNVPRIQPSARDEERETQKQKAAN